MCLTADGDPVVVTATAQIFTAKPNLYLPPDSGPGTFVARFAADGSGPDFSKEFGGENDRATAVALSPTGGIVVAGTTSDPGFAAGMRIVGGPDGTSSFEGWLAELDPDMFQEETDKLVAARAAAGKPVERVHLEGHSHISETYAVGTGDRSLSLPVLQFVRRVSATHRR